MIVDHQHCPYDCEHPQPFMREGKLYCGRCYFTCSGLMVEMVPCTPELCGDDDGEVAADVS